MLLFTFVLSTFFWIIGECSGMTLCKVEVLFVLPAFGFFVPKTVRSRFLPRLGKPDIGWSLHETDPDETRHWGLIGHRDWVRFCSDLFRHFQGSINGASEKRPFWFSFAFSWSPARVLSFGTPGRCQAMPDRSIVMLTSTE